MSKQRGSIGFLEVAILLCLALIVLCLGGLVNNQMCF